MRIRTIHALALALPGLLVVLGGTPGSLADETRPLAERAATTLHVYGPPEVWARPTQPDLSDVPFVAPYPPETLTLPCIGQTPSGAGATYTFGSPPPGLGEKSGGYTFSGAGWMAGPVYPLWNAGPTSLSEQVYSPTGSVSGAVVVQEPATSTHAWRGTAPLSFATPGWTRTPVNPMTTVFTWRRYTGGVADGTTAPDSTYAAFNASHGGLSDTVVGFLFGCGGTGFAVDGMDVVDAGIESVYDFEGTHVAWDVTAEANHCKSDYTRHYPIRLPITLEAHPKGYPHDASMTLTLQYEPYRAGRTMPIKEIGKVTVPGNVETYDLTVPVARSGFYSVSFPGSSTMNASQGRSDYLYTSPAAHLHAVQRGVHVGDTIEVRGRFDPHERFKYLPYVIFKSGRTWSEPRKLRLTPTDKHGGFVVRLKATQIGTYGISVASAQTKDFSWGQSPYTLVNAAARPVHHVPPPHNTTPTPPPSIPAPPAPPGPSHRASAC